MELEIKRKRITDSVVKRRAAGKDFGGRRRTFSNSQIRNAIRLIESDEPATRVAQDLGMSRATLYRRIRELPEVVGERGCLCMVAVGALSSWGAGERPETALIAIRLLTERVVNPWTSGVPRGPVLGSSGGGVVSRGGGLGPAHRVGPGGVAQVRGVRGAGSGPVVGQFVHGMGEQVPLQRW